MRLRTWSPTRRTAVPLVLAVLGSLAAIAPGAASAATSEGQLYVNDNTAGANTIAGFARQADGGVTPLAGSPFAAGGAGTGSGLASQGAIQLARRGRLLVAVDAGSD